MSWVWEHSRSGPTQRLVLLAIADCANDRGADAYPATSTLAKKTGLSERGVRKAISELAILGELRVEYKAGPRGVNRFRIVMPDPEPDAGSAEEEVEPEVTRHDVPSAPGAGSTRNDVPGTRHETTVDPAPGAPKPSRNRPSKETSGIDTPDPHRPDVEKICRHLADRIVDNGSKRPTITAKWRTEARLLLDKDGRTVEQVIKAIDWCQADPFWHGNILSMPTLRQQYDKLRLAAQRNGTARASPASTAPEAVPPDQRCPEHPNQHADSCRDCRARRLAKPKGAR